MPQKLVYEKFYVHEIAVVKLSKIYFLKNAKKNVNQTTTIYIAIELDKNFEKKIIFFASNIPVQYRKSIFIFIEIFMFFLGDIGCYY